MTIDESIEKHKKLKISAERNNDKRGAFYSAEEHEQLAEWLEDYERIKMLIPIEQALKAEYNKAIDDFVKMLYEELLYEDGLTEIDVDYIAEQLKAGGKDEAYNQQRNYDKGSYARC